MSIVMNPALPDALINKVLIDRNDEVMKANKKLKEENEKLTKEKQEIINDLDELMEKYDQQRCEKCGIIESADFLCEDHEECGACCVKPKCMDHRYGVGRW